MRYYSLILGIIVIVHSANVMQVFGQEPDYVIVTEADAFISGRNNGNDPSTVVKTLPGQSMPADYVLQANYPNPFNPSTQISYYLKQTRSAKMTIYNTLGQAIRVFDLQATSGWHTLTWDGCDQNGVRVPSGIYLYHLKADNTRLTRKMVLTQ
jgi:hypothetical protein